jgi:hypothetical protein
MNIIRERKNYWVRGSIVAFIGVAAVRLIAPELAGLINKVVLVSGYLLSLTGIIIIARAAKA